MFIEVAAGRKCYMQHDCGRWRGGEKVFGQVCSDLLNMNTWEVLQGVGNVSLDKTSW